MNRWKIEIPKRKISSIDFDNHIDDIEMSGEKVSGIIKYGTNNKNLIMDRHLVYPMFRYQPDNTHSSYSIDIDDTILNIDEKFVKVEIDGILHIYTKTNEFNIVHHFYPSTTLPIFYEKIEVENITSENKILNYDNYKKINIFLGCEGYIYTERICDIDVHNVKPKEIVELTFGFSSRFVNENVPKEKNSMQLRINRVNELLEECDFTCGNVIIDTMFAFSKIRAGESVFNTRKGLIHSPGGANYYAGIWCNDQCEYSTPWFGFTGDKKLYSAAKNAIKWLEPYMTDELLPIPSSLISEGTDYWNGAKDRGDASMFLYGSCRFLLEAGIDLNNGIGKQLEWAYKYIKSKINENNIVVSDTDELENRISSGINLNTSSLSYGGLKYYYELLKKDNKNDEANECLKLSQKIKNGIESYFGGNINGYDTYHYHKDCNVIRAWNSLPIYMGINERKDGTIKSIIDNLWKEGSCLSTENEKTMWDRSAAYFIASLFRANYNELAFNKLLEMSETRLLKDRVPYLVEAYPENNMRQLSAESALYCRIIVDGLIHIDFENGIKITPHVPKSIKEFKMNNIVVEGKRIDIYYKNGVVEIKNWLEKERLE